jgi:SagB-type dehydrogenase family enzyme
MNKVFSIFFLGLFFVAMVGSGFTQDLQSIQLPEPKLDPSKSLAQALTDRKTSREFSPGDLSPQQMSNLLWAAFGVNRADAGKRTAPSAYNRQEMDIYVTTAKGTYLYDAKANLLKPVATGDIRQQTGTQSYFKDAAINLVFVADFNKMGDSDETIKMFIAAADSGFISENVYLYCASEGLATVIRAGIDKAKLGELLKLESNQKITFAQSVGLPKK